MEFTVDSLTLVIHQLKSVATIPIHMLVTVRNAAITEQEAHLVRGLGTQ